MSRLLYKDNEYTLRELLDLKRISPYYKEGSVLDLETGEELDIQNLENLKDQYINELVSKKDRNDLINRNDRKKVEKELEEKYQNGTITKQELKTLLIIQNNAYYNKKDDVLEFKISYKSFFIVNMCKDKPKNVSHSDYGKFMHMLNLLAYDSRIRHDNGKSIKKELLIKMLEFKSENSFNNYISKLRKYSMVATVKSGGKNGMYVNPAYAQRNMRLTNEIYELFKEDLDEFLTDKQKTYLNMKDDGVDIDGYFSFV